MRLTNTVDKSLYRSITQGNGTRQMIWMVDPTQDRDYWRALVCGIESPGSIGHEVKVIISFTHKI